MGEYREHGYGRTRTLATLGRQEAKVLQVAEKAVGLRNSVSRFLALVTVIWFRLRALPLVTSQIAVNAHAAPGA